MIYCTLDFYYGSIIRDFHLKQFSWTALKYQKAEVILRFTHNITPNGILIISQILFSFYDFSAITISQKLSENFTLNAIQKLEKGDFGLALQPCFEFRDPESGMGSKVFKAANVVHLQFMFVCLYFV